MEEKIVKIVNEMAEYLNISQMKKLQEVLLKTLSEVETIKTEIENEDYLCLFLGRGEMGRCAVVPCDGYLCGTGSLLIRTKGEVTADYIQKIISFPSFKKLIEDMAVGQTMPNLNVPTVSNFQIIKTPMEIQNSYYRFVAQVDKSKFTLFTLPLLSQANPRGKGILSNNLLPFGNPA